MTAALDIRSGVAQAASRWMLHPNDDTYNALKAHLCRMNERLDEVAPGEFYMDTPEVTCHEESVALLTWCRDNFKEHNGFQDT